MEAYSSTYSPGGIFLNGETLDLVNGMISAVRPMLEEAVAEGERENRLPRRAAQALIDVGAFRLQVPRSLGGLEVDPLHYIHFIERLSKIDPSAGFLVGNMNSQAFAMMALPAQGAEEIFSDERAAISGGAFPPATAERTEGGYFISGRAPFASGADFASWVTAYALLGSEDNADAGRPTMLIAVMPKSDCTRIANWDVMGLKGTGSHDFSYSRVFVPEHRAAPLTLGDPNHHFSGPLFKSRLWSGHPAFAATALGIARASLDEVTKLIMTKKGNFMGSYIGESSSVQRLLGKAEARYRASRAYLYDTVEELWEFQKKGEFVNVDHGVAMQLAACYVIETAREIAEYVHEISGSTGFREGNMLEKNFRDLHTISQHAFASQSRYESAVKAMLGLPNDWLFFQL